MEYYNVWDLVGVHVKITKGFLDKLNYKIFVKFKTKRQAHNFIFKNKEYPYSTFKNLLKPSYQNNQFIPLDFLINICDISGISRQELQKSTISYKSQRSVNYIENPILPIEINPVFDMIYAHNIGDGTVCVVKNRLPYFAYRQFNQLYREGYTKKIEFIFGNVKYKKKKFEEVTRVRCPTALSSLFFKYYGLNDRSFLSETARISPIIYEKGKDRKLAVLIAFIIDEGHIDSTQITIVLKNRLLIEDLQKICYSLGYKTTVVYKKGDYEKYVSLNILRQGMKKLFNDYLKINKRYPLIDLGFKGEKIRKSFEIVNRKIKKTKGNQNIILEVLKDEQLSVNQLANRINMTRQGIRYHVHNLLNKGKIRIIDNKPLNWIYGV